MHANIELLFELKKNRWDDNTQSRKHWACCWLAALLSASAFIRQDEINSSINSSRWYMVEHGASDAIKSFKSKTNCKRRTIWLHLHAEVLTYFLNDCCLLVVVVIVSIIIIAIKMYSKFCILENNWRPLMSEHLGKQCVQRSRITELWHNRSVNCLVMDLDSICAGCWFGSEIQTMNKLK